ncbi:hypothetical protein PO909_023834 [Leuciscus waleckii]
MAIEQSMLQQMVYSHVHTYLHCTAFIFSSAVHHHSTVLTKSWTCLSQEFFRALNITSKHGTMYGIEKQQNVEPCYHL